MKNTLRSGFTLIELVVVILILAVLAGALVPRVTDRLAKARDEQRLEDMNEVRDAIEQYYLDKGKYPEPRKNSGFGGWDVSHDKNFIPELVKTGYLRAVPSDPINDDTYHYRYYVYPKGAYGCKGNTDYYVLGVRTFETDDFKKKNPGYFKCNQRNWASEFGWVTGGGASQKK
jgi:type II secretion system protein G